MSGSVAGSGRVGVVVMAYGTPSSPDDIEAYYTDIRRGRPPTPEQLAELRGRYEAIGGLSTLAARTEAQRAGLAAALQRARPDTFRVVTGTKHAAPRIADAVTQLASEGIGSLVGLVMAPHFSRTSVGDYHARAADAAAEHDCAYQAIDRWYDEPAYVALLGDAVREAVTALGTPVKATKVLFTAHSLPESALVGDPYPDELFDGAGRIAAAAGLLRWAGWSAAWQSAGRTGQAWRGPDVNRVLGELAASGRADGVVVCPHGFTADHLEVAYDLDIVARRTATEAGLAFARTQVMNDDPAVLAALAARVVWAAERAGWLVR